MPAPYHTTRPRKLTIHLPEDTMARLDLFLFSESQQRVPKGAYKEFFMARIEEFFSRPVTPKPESQE